MQSGSPAPKVPNDAGFATQAQRKAFLGVVWRVFSGNLQKPFSIKFLDGFLDESVVTRLGHGDDVADWTPDTSIEAIVAACSTEELVNGSFERAISTIKARWEQFLPEAKSELLNAARRHELSGIFDESQHLTDADKEYLRIRWDLADILYFHERDQTFLLCNEKGWDVLGHLLNPKANPELSPHQIVEAGAASILQLLESRVRADIAAVNIAVPGGTAVYLTHIDNRLFDEYLGLLSEMRDGIRQFLVNYVGHNRSEAVTICEDWLDHAIQRKFERFRSHLHELRASPEVYRAMLDLIGAAAPMEVRMGDEYHVQQANIVGPHGQSYGHVVIQNVTAGQLDLSRLAAELERLTDALRHKASTPEEAIAVGQIAAAEVEARNNRGANVSKLLSKSGAWAFDVATKIGTTLAATAIKDALGLK